MLEGISNGNRYASANAKQISQCVNWNYARVGRKKPVVLVAENPLEMHLLFNYVTLRLKAGSFNRTEGQTELLEALENQLFAQKSQWASTWMEEKLSSPQKDLVDFETDSDFGKEVDEALFSKLYYPAFKELEEGMDAELNALLSVQIRFPLRKFLGDQLGEAIDQSLASYLAGVDHGLCREHHTFLFTMNLYSDCIYGWYNYLSERLGLDFTRKKLFLKSFLLGRSAGIAQSILSKDLVVVSKYPTKVHVDTKMNVHRFGGPAVEWASFSRQTAFNQYVLDGQYSSDGLQADDSDLTVLKTNKCA